MPDLRPAPPADPPADLPADPPVDARSVGDAGVDLLLGGRCAGCSRPGRILCGPCRASLPTRGAAYRPNPAPPGLVASYAAGRYDALLRDLVVGHKEHGLHGLGGPLGELLAHAVATGLADRGVPPGDPVLLVPVPSRASSVRSRGHDPTAAITAGAAGRLGDAVICASLLRLRPGVVDQAGLDATRRRQNLAGAMAVRGRALRALARRRSAVHVVLCDDVLTTGSTAREAQRALTAVGLAPLAVATVAATPRRTAAPSAAHSESSAPEVPDVFTEH